MHIFEKYHKDKSKREREKDERVYGKHMEKLHSMPEIGVETPATCGYLKEQLLSFGYEGKDVAGGLVGILDSL